MCVRQKYLLSDPDNRWHRKQEDEEGRKILIFSVWNSPIKKVKAIGDTHHSDCIIRPFGGEGEGMQCLLYKSWEIGTKVTQVKTVSLF